MSEHGVDRLDWDDLHKLLDHVEAQAKQQRRSDAEARRLRKHFWADQEGMQTWFYRKDAREW